MIIINEIVWNNDRFGYDVYLKGGEYIFSTVHPNKWGAVEKLYIWKKIINN